MALEKITMPQLGESVTEGTISKWLVAPGEHVNKYDPLAEVMTDKVNAEIPSSFTGTIHELIAKDGETLEVGEVICTIEIEDGQTVDLANLKQGEASPREKDPATINKNSDTTPKMKTRYSPAVLRLAQEHEIDLTTVTGSGRGGRITRKDLQKLIDSGEVAKQATAKQPIQSEVQHQSKVQTLGGDIEIPVTPVRKAIASNMVRSKHEIPHAWMMMEVDVTNLVKYRDAVKDEFRQREGFNLTYFAFFVKAIAQALREFPMMNAMWAGEKIVQKNDIHLSIAVATDDALYVPVIQHADEKSIKGIAKDIAELSNKVRNGTLKSVEAQGGTFTVNNTGSFGSIQSMGIINYPQAAILQIESIVKRPVIIDGMIAVRDMVNLCLSLDHRVLDGLVCGRFLQRLKAILENMSQKNSSIY